MKGENIALIGVGLAAAMVAGVVIYRKRQQATQEPSFAPTPTLVPAAPSILPTNTTPYLAPGGNGTSDLLQKLLSPVTAIPDIIKSPITPFVSPIFALPKLIQAVPEIVQSPITQILSPITAIGNLFGGGNNDHYNFTDYNGQPIEGKVVNVGGTTDYWLITDGKRTRLNLTNGNDVFDKYGQILHVSQTVLNSIPFYIPPVVTQPIYNSSGYDQFERPRTQDEYLGGLKGFSGFKKLRY